MAEKSTREKVADLLELLNLQTAETLLKRVRDPECDAATLNAARAFLKDNEINSTPSANPHLKDLNTHLGDVELSDPHEPIRFREA